MVGKLSRIRLKHVDAIIAPTDKVGDALREYGVENTIHVVPRGISLEQHNTSIYEYARDLCNK